MKLIWKSHVINCSSGKFVSFRSPPLLGKDSVKGIILKLFREVNFSEHLAVVVSETGFTRLNSHAFFSFFPLFSSSLWWLKNVREDNQGKKVKNTFSFATRMVRDESVLEFSIWKHFSIFRIFSKWQYFLPCWSLRKIWLGRTVYFKIIRSINKCLAKRQRCIQNSANI